MGSVGVAVASAALYAFTLGLVGVVNPCGPPLLPAYLSLFVGDESSSRARHAQRVLGAAERVTVGFVACFALLVLSGAHLAYYWMAALASPASTLPLSAQVERAQTTAFAGLGANAPGWARLAASWW